MTEVLSFAGHFQDGAGSDKVWGAALYIGMDGSAIYAKCWGKRGSSLQSSVAHGKPDPLKKKYQFDVADKTTGGYRSIDPHDYGILSALLAASPTLMGEYKAGRFERHYEGGSTISPPAVNGMAYSIGGPISKQVRIVASHVSTMKPGVSPMRYVENDAWGMTEKANGTRFFIEKKGTVLTGYNRKGQAQYDVPEGARQLVGLSLDCLIDGERMEGVSAGQYVMFDLLEINGESIRHRSYTYRIALLEALMCKLSGLSAYGRPHLPNLYWAEPDTDMGKLVLLAAESDPLEKRRLFEGIENIGGEGVIFRRLEAPSVAGNTPNELKHKFTCDLDAVITSTNLPRGTASLNLALLRPSDGTLIDIGSVRSGLTDADVQVMEEVLSQDDIRGGGTGSHQWPVIKVSFLKARTIGVKLVEPTAWLSDLRTDKNWWDCTTEQLVEIFGDNRRGAISMANRATLYDDIRR